MVMLKTCLLTSKPIWPYKSQSICTDTAEAISAKELKVAEQEAHEEEKKLSDRLRTRSTEDIDDADDIMMTED